MAVCGPVFRHKASHLFQLDRRDADLAKHSPNREVSERAARLESLLDRLPGDGLAEQVRDGIGRPAKKEETEGKLVWVLLQALEKRLATLLALAGRAGEELSEEGTEAALYALKARVRHLRVEEALDGVTAHQGLQSGRSVRRLCDSHNQLAEQLV